MIEGLQVIDLTVHRDPRGWFKETWRASSGFHPVQHNLSFNESAGTVRGLHAEPWDKLVTVSQGRVFGAWMDLREESPTYREIFTHEISEDTAVFVPRGVANGFQTLTDNVTYSYLVSDYYSATAPYLGISYKHIQWPQEITSLSEKDATLPMESDPMPPLKILVTGADGQLGRALQKVLGDRGKYFTRSQFDITNPPELPWRQYAAIINTAAYNNVDKAEDERAVAWAVNAAGPAKLARIATAADIPLVHVSTDYVFDGAKELYCEDDPVAPLSFYGASKAAGDEAAATAPKHYVVRTSWVFGDGNNFVRTMKDLADRGVEPRVVHDQVGKPTSADTLAKAIVHLLNTRPEYGVYNASGTGEAVSRDEWAMATFIGLGHDPAEVHPVSTAEYHGDQPHARRPSRSVLDTQKLEATGFTPENWRVSLAVYLA